MANKRNRPGVPSNPKRRHAYGNSLSVQRQRVLQRLTKDRKVSTIQFRDDGIMHPAGCVMELRREGYRIILHWVSEPDPNGVAHRVSQYVFHGFHHFQNLEV